MVTLGVDLASQPKRTATCLIHWDSTSARIERLSIGATNLLPGSPRWVSVQKQVALWALQFLRGG